MRIALCRPSHEPLVRELKLARTYAEMGHEVIFVGNTRRTHSRPAAHIASQRFVGISYPYRSRWVPFGTIAYNASLFRELGRLRPDIVLAGDFESLPGAALYKRWRGDRCRLIYDIADSYSARYRIGNVTRSIIERVDDELMSWCDDVLLPQENRYGNFRFRWPKHYRIVPNCPFFSDAPAFQATLPTLPVRILISGLVTWPRGVREIVTAAEQSGVAKVCVVPGGPLDADMRSFLQASEVIEMLPQMPQRKLLDLARECHLIAAYYEPTSRINVQAAPNKVFDAMAVGRPCLINSEVELATTVVQDWKCGFAVPYRDTNALVEVIRSLSQNAAESQHLGSNGRRLFEEKFHWEAVTRDAANWGTFKFTASPANSKPNSVSQRAA